MIELFDSHCHLSQSKYNMTPREVVDDAKTEGVVGFINIGTSLYHNSRVIKVAEEIEGVWASCAIYPHEELRKDLQKVLSELEKQLSSSKKAVAVGECGIDVSDGWSGGRALEEQVEIFEDQLKLAVKHNLPVIVHNRGGDEIILGLLKKYVASGLKGVMHCFSGNWETAQKFLDLGFYLSFSGMVTYPSRRELHEVAKLVPEDRFVLETDAPYLPPQGRRGEVNFPKYVKMVAEKVAQLREKSVEGVAAAATQNTKKLFHLP